MWCKLKNTIYRCQMWLGGDYLGTTAAGKMDVFESRQFMYLLPN